MTLESKLSASVHSFGRSSPPRDGGEMAFSAGRQRVGGWLRLYHRVVAGHLSRYAMHSSVSTYWAQKRGSRKSFCFKRNQKSLLLLLDNKRFGSFDAPIPFFRDRTRDLGMPENLLQSHALPTELRRGCLMMFQAGLRTETVQPHKSPSPAANTRPAAISTYPAGSCACALCCSPTWTWLGPLGAELRSDLSSRH